MRLIDADKTKKQINQMQTLKTSERNLFRLALDRTPTYETPNDPLTLEELRGMDGEPVWVVDGDCGYYALIGCVYETCIWITSRYDADYCLMFSGYGADWLAYRRKPEEGT